MRLDRVRGRIDHDDPRWFDAQAEAVVAFWRTGGLPEDGLHLEWLLVQAEMGLLAVHRRGKDVAEGMAHLNRVAGADGDESTAWRSERAARRRNRRRPCAVSESHRDAAPRPTRGADRH